MVDEALLNRLALSYTGACWNVFRRGINSLRQRKTRPTRGETFVFKIPQPETDRALWILTECEEATIGFDRWHCHESAWLEDEESATKANIVQRAIELIEDILTEREVVVVRFKDDAWVGSTLQPASDRIESIHGEVAQVYSRRGTFSRLVTS